MMRFLAGLMIVELIVGWVAAAGWLAFTKFDNPPMFAVFLFGPVVIAGLGWRIGQEFE